MGYYLWFYAVLEYRIGRQTLFCRLHGDKKAHRALHGALDVSDWTKLSVRHTSIQAPRRSSTFWWHHAHNVAPKKCKLRRHLSLFQDLLKKSGTFEKSKKVIKDSANLSPLKDPDRECTTRGRPPDVGCRHASCAHAIMPYDIQLYPPRSCKPARWTSASIPVFNNP